MFNLSIRTSRSFSAKLVSPQPVLVHGIVPSQVQDFLELWWVPVSAFLQPLEVLLNGSTIMWCMNFPLSFVSFADLLRVHSVPSSRSVTKIFQPRKPIVSQGCIKRIVASRSREGILSL